MSNSMRLNLIMGLIDKITGPIQKVTSETDRMGDRVKKTQAALNQLGNNAKDIEHLRALQERSGRTSSALQEAQAKAKALAQEMNASAAPTQKMSAAFERATAQVKRLQEQQQAERLELQQTTGRLKEAGVSTQRLDEATRRIAVETKRYNEQLAKEQKALDRVAEKQKHLAEVKQRNSDMKMGAMGDAVGVGAAILGAKKLVDAYGEVVTARNDGLALGLDESGIDSITAKAKAFSDMWSGTTQAEFIAGAVEIKSAIDTLGAEAIGDFTKIAALVAKSTKSTTAEMTSLMSTGYGVYRRQFDEFGKTVVSGWDKMGQEERDIKFGEYFAAGLVECVNVFKSDGKQMSAALTNLGATATSANVSFAEQLAILGQLQLTMSGSEAATKYRAFIGAAGGAAKKLGLDFTDANDNLKAMPEILEELKDKFGDTLDAVETQKMKEAFGTDEAIALIQLLYPEVDSLKKNIGGMQEALKGGMSTTQKMAEVMNSGPSEAFQLMGQRIQNASVSVGEQLAPAMVLGANLIGQLAQFVGYLAEQFPFLSQVLAFAAVGLVGLKVASIAARLSFAFFSDAVLLAGKTMSFFTLTNLRAQAVMLLTRLRSMAAATALFLLGATVRGITVITALMTAAQWAFNAVLSVTRVRTMAAAAGVVLLGAASRAFALGAAVMTAAQWALNAALMANPIGLVVAAIMALIAIVALVVRYWEPIKGFFAGLWSGVVGIFSAAWDLIKGLLSLSPAGLLMALWEPIKGFFSGLWSGVVSVFSGAWDGISALLSMSPLEILMGAWEPITAFFSGLWQGITDACGRAIDWITEKIAGPFSAIKDFVSGLFGDDTAAGAVAQMPAPPAAPGATPAGPAAPGEVAAPAVPAKAAVGAVPSPAARSAAPAPAPTQYGQIIIHAAPGMSAEDVAKLVRKELEARDRALANKQRGRLGD